MVAVTRSRGRGKAAGGRGGAEGGSKAAGRNGSTHDAGIGPKATAPATASVFVRFPLMAALAIQYGLQTEFQHKYLSKDVNKLTSIFVCEVMKLLIAAAALTVESLRGTQLHFFSKRTLRSVVMCALPALIYVVQNVCIQTAYGELNAITFNCLNQTKLITTAAALFFIKGVRQNGKQMVALTLVSAGAMLLSVKDGPGAGPSSSPLGLAMILGASVLSGVAATLTQIFMQDLKLNAFLVTLSMCLVSLVAVGFSLASQVAMGASKGPSAASLLDLDWDQVQPILLRGWTVWSLIPVGTQALGGLLVGLVTKYCGSLDKGVAFVCGLAVSAVAECALSGVALPWNAALALVFVGQGSFMHTRESFNKKQKSKGH